MSQFIKIKAALFTVFFSAFLGLTSSPVLAGTTESSAGVRQSKVLVVMTNHAQYPNRPDTTGLWLTELTHFYEVFHEAGISMDFASPKGGNVPLGKRSLSGGYTDDNAKKLLASADFSKRLTNTRAAAEINPADYDVIYFTGGQGTMWDFKDNPDLKRLAEGIYNNGGIVSAVCHGTTALLSLQTTDGKPFIANRRVTGFSSLEEFFAGVRSLVPFDLQTELEQRGANYEKSWLPFMSYVITDGRLVTGQNPESTRDLAKAVLQAMRDNIH